MIYSLSLFDTSGQSSSAAPVVPRKLPGFLRPPGVRRGPGLVQQPAEGLHPGLRLQLPRGGALPARSLRRLHESRGRHQSLHSHRRQGEGGWRGTDLLPRPPASSWLFASFHLSLCPLQLTHGFIESFVLSCSW